MQFLKNIYKISPPPLQNLYVSSFGIYWHWARLKGEYKRHLASFRQREWFTSQEWSHFQNQELKKILSVCLEYVPYYQNIWTKAQIQAAKKGDLPSLPILDKSPLRQHPGQFRRLDKSHFPKHIFHTSGTTGTPIETQFSLSELRASLALREVRSANWAGVSFNQPRATFSGRIVEPKVERETHIYRYNLIEKQVYFSTFHLKSSTATLYVDAIRKFNIVWMTGYASAFYLLARFILNQKLKIPKLKAIITTSEKLTPAMRKIMEKAYGCPIFEEYSTVENALFASECEEGRLHVSPDVSIVEILRPDGSPCEPGEVGEVVTTCLMRSYQPLVRFRLGDLAAWDPEPCPCGRQMPVIKEVVGRIEDVVTCPDGRQLVRFHGIFVNQPNIIEGQIIQENLDRFIVKVVTTENFNVGDIEEIKRRMAQRLCSNIHVEVEEVNKIPRSKSGKFQAVISNVNKP